MYTTFGSFKVIGACGGGRSRFLDILGGSSRNLPEGQHTRLPVWFPLLMNPGSDDELSWLFRKEMTYIHDETMFRDFFERTRHNVARTCAIAYLSMVARDIGVDYGDTSVFKLQNERVRLNNSARTMAVIGLYHACAAAMRGERAFDGPDMVRALRAFETVNSNVLEFPRSGLELPPADLEPEFNRGHLVCMWPLWTLAVTEGHSGPFTAPIFAQKYYVQCYLYNAHRFATWGEGTQVHFGKLWSTTSAGLDDDDDEDEAPRPRGRASASRLLTSNKKKAKAKATAETRKKGTAVKLPETREEFEALAAIPLSRFPGTYRLTYRYTSEIPADKKSETVDTSAALTPSSGRLKMRRPEPRVTPRSRHPSVTADLLMRDPYADDAAYAAQATPEPEEDGTISDSYLPRYLRSQNRYILRWVHQTFDTGAFFSRLRFLNEFAPPPEGITVDWLRSLSAPVNTAVLRTDDGAFVAGTITFTSPRLLAAVMEHVRNLQVSGKIQESKYEPLPVAPVLAEPTNVVRLVATDETPEEPRPGDDEIIDMRAPMAEGINYGVAAE